MRTLNDIVPPSRRKDMDVPPTNSPGTPQSREPLRIVERPPRFPYTTLFVALIVIAGSIGALMYFSNAKVEITPKEVSAAVQGTFVASQTGSNIPFQVISAEKVASQSVESTGTKNVTANASGMITVFNTQSKTQTLIANTRFATNAGLVFRIRQAITVPAGTADKPGSITTRVYADQPGSNYNVGPTSFTIPGFVGTPQATAVYARSTTSMTGGSSGASPSIDSVIETQTRAALIAALAPDLQASIEAQVPAGYVLLKGSATTSFETLTPTPSATTGMVDVKEQGTISAVVFPNAALAKAIAMSIPGLNYEGEPLTLDPTSDLKLSASRAPGETDESFSFALSGTASLVYTVDPSRIAAAVSGKTRSAAEVALTNYPEVKRALITLRPFWKQSFPQDPSAIHVVVAGEEN
jgi:hypothetical protein